MSAAAVIFAMLIIISMRGAKSYTFDLHALIPEFKSADDALIIDSSLKDGIHTDRFSLRKGVFQIYIDYEADADYSVFVPVDNDNNTTIVLPAGKGIASGEIVPAWPTDRAYFVFSAPDDGTVRINSISISSERMLYTDGIFQLVILLTVYALLLYFIMKWDDYSDEKKKAALAILLMAVIINLPYYLQRDPLNAMTRFGIDTRAHLLRLEGAMYGLLDGQFPVVISPNFLNENGELTFLYPNLFLYPFAVLRLLHASMPFVFRLICVTVNILTALSMYYACRKMRAANGLALFFTGIYLFEPHRLWVMFGQGAALGAGIAFIFAPLAIAGVYLILKRENTGAYMLAVGMTGILQSHVTSLMLLLILMGLLFLVFTGELLKDGGKGMKLTGKSILLAAGMNIGVIVPFLYYYNSGVNTSGLIWGNWEEVLWGAPDFFTNDMSLFFLTGIIIAVVKAVITHRRDTEYRMSVVLLSYTAVFFAMTLKLFPWSRLMEVSRIMKAFADYMQIPERFYTIMSPALLLAVLLMIRDDIPGRAYAAAASCICGMVLIYGLCVNLEGYVTNGPLLYDQVTGDMNSKQLFDYLPEGEDIYPEMEVSGVASLSDWDAAESIAYHKQGTHVDYTYIAQDKEVYAEFPLFYYKGYSAWDENGDAVELYMGQSGRIKAYLRNDGIQHEIHTGFKVEPLFSVLYLISLVFSCISLLYYNNSVISRKRGRLL